MSVSDYEISAEVTFTGAELAERMHKILHKVETGKASDDELEELGALATFRNSNAGKITNWATTTFMTENEIDEDFARQHAEGQFSGIDFDVWPFLDIDWDNAAESLREDLKSAEWASGGWNSDYSYYRD